MTRVVIIGNAGGGKSTLARWLSAMLGLPLHAVDRVQWKPGWQPAPPEEFSAVHGQWLAEPRWIIDGWGDFAAIEERFRAADTIVLVDFPLWRHYWWALKRQVGCLFRPREDGPPRCPMLPMTWPLLKMIRAIDRDLMPRLREHVVAQRERCRVHHIRTLAELREFRTEVERYCGGRASASSSSG
jgi:adenylate kinase family enzyme